MRTTLVALVLALALGTAAASTFAAETTPRTEKAVFAGGCFWCMEAAFDGLPGVKAAVSGYTGGELQNPTYESHEGHVEAVEVTFDPAVVPYDKLLEVFWHNVDPTDPGGQFCDRGPAYTSEIFTLDDSQKAAAQSSKARIEATKTLKDPIVTKVVPAGRFWPAEDYHQQYARKNPLRYRFYRHGCGRDARLKKLWGQAPE